jgi:glycosyltransferase involved in cell wall biosynthesis
MHSPLISIVICCHNRAHMLPHTIESVLAQNYKPVEVILFDDGSTDNTEELIAGYGNKVRYHWQENAGVAVARTNACRLAKGEFIAFQDDDDLMPPDRITRLHEALLMHPSAVLAVGDWAEIDENGELTGKRSSSIQYSIGEAPILIKNGYKAVLWPEVTPTPHTTLFRKSDGDNIGWFDTRFSHACEDTDFFARFGKIGPIVYVPQVVSYYRRAHISQTSQSERFSYSKFLLLEKHLLSMEADQTELKKRLRFRMLKTLKRLARHNSNALKPAASVPTGHLKNKMALLGLKNYLAYTWFTQIKIPLRRFILRQG